MVLGGAPPRCPQCRGRLAFGTDRSGRAVEQCECGYRNYVAVRTGSAAAEQAVQPPDLSKQA